MSENPVALSEFGSGLPAFLLVHLALDDPLVLVVVALELTGGVYLQVPVWLCARVAEGVVDPLGLEDERAGWGEEDLASYVEGQLAFQHEGSLVLVGVGVRRDHLARSEAHLDDREGAAEALCRDLVGDVQDGEVGAFSRADEDLLVGRHGVLPSSSDT